MADVTAGLIWYRLKEFVGEASERLQQMDVVDMWFLAWVGLSLLGILIVQIITSFKWRTHAADASVPHSNHSSTVPVSSESVPPANTNTNTTASEPQARRASELDGSESCVWLNALVAWLTNGAASGSVSILSLVSVWIVALNEAVKDTKGTAQQLLFERVLPGGSPPALSAVRVRSSNARSIVLLARVRTADTWLRVLCGRRYAEQAYNVKLMQLEGQVRIEVAQADNQLSISVQFVSSPEIKLEVRPVGKADAGVQRKPSVPPQIEQNWLEARISRAIQECVLKLNLNTAIAPTRATPNGAATPVPASPPNTAGLLRTMPSTRSKDDQREPEIAKALRPPVQTAPVAVAHVAENATVPAQHSPPSVTLTAPISAVSPGQERPKTPPRSSSPPPPPPPPRSSRLPADDFELAQEEMITPSINGSVSASPMLTPMAMAAPSLSPSLRTQPVWSTPTSKSASTERRLLLKIVKASGLGAREFGCRSAHCVVSIDYPPKGQSTPSVRGTVNPFWDSQFLFDLTAQSTKLTFEIFDDDVADAEDARFLGQAVLGLDTLRDVPSSRQILPLRSRTGEPDNATGTITVELLLLENPDFEAMPITAQAHEYTLPLPKPTASASVLLSEPPVNGVSSRPPPPPLPLPPPNDSAALRIIVETSRLETPGGDIITTSHTMHEKTTEDEPPPVPQRTTSLAEPKKRSGTLPSAVIVAEKASRPAVTDSNPRVEDDQSVPKPPDVSLAEESEVECRDAMENVKAKEDSDGESIRTFASSFLSRTSTDHSEATMLDEETMRQLDLENPLPEKPRKNHVFSLSAPTLNTRIGVSDINLDFDADVDVASSTLTPIASSTLANLLDESADNANGQNSDEDMNLADDSSAFVHLTPDVSIVEIEEAPQLSQKADSVHAHAVAVNTLPPPDAESTTVHDLTTSSSNAKPDSVKQDRKKPRQKKQDKKRKKVSEPNLSTLKTEKVGDHEYTLISEVASDNRANKKPSGLLKRSASNTANDYRTRTLPANVESTLTPSDQRASSPKRSKPISSLFKRKSGGTSDKDKDKKEQKERAEMDTSKKSSSSKKQKEQQPSTKDLEQATLRPSEVENGSLKRSKSSGLGGSFRKLFGGSSRDKSRRTTSGTGGNSESPT